MRSDRRGGWLLLGLMTALLGALPGPSRLSAAEDQATRGIETLTWIAGHWRAENGGLVFEEHWTDASGGLMLAASRTLKDGQVVFFEFLRIEGREDGIYFVAQPRGRPGVDFRLTKLTETEAIFENPAHDFPRRFTYRRGQDGSLTARIDGGEGAMEGAKEFHFRRPGESGKDH